MKLCMKILLPLLLLVAILISGCGGSQNSSEPCLDYCAQQPHADCIGEWQVSVVDAECKCDFICNEETANTTELQPVEVPACTNECDSSGCVGTKSYDCIIKPDGCKGKAGLRITKNKCGVECMSNSDCSGQECTAYKCKAATVSFNLNTLPKPFSDDSILVVGANAPGSDVAAATDISSMLIFEGGKRFDLKLDNQITEEDYAHNLILIGSPCDNSMIETVFGIVCDGIGLNESQAMLKLADSRGKAALLISGKTPAATLKAAKQVANYGSSGLSGSEMIINAA